MTRDEFIKKFPVGSRVTLASIGSVRIVLFHGEFDFFFRFEDAKVEASGSYHLTWEAAPPPPKKVVRMAPALCRNQGRYELSAYLYSDEATAREKVYEFVRWPASDNLWVEIEVES